MADVSTLELLRRLVIACSECAIVESYVLEAMDDETLGVRVYLFDGAFINVFYNLATGKVAFALIRNDERVHGKDNAKIDWHVHPFGNPQAHEPCSPVDFETFLREVEQYYEGA